MTIFAIDWRWLCVCILPSSNTTNSLIKKLTIKHFRGLRKLSIPGCTRMNMLVGGNGAGKTSILEAICLACNGNKPQILPLLVQVRGHQPGLALGKDLGLRSMFYDLNPQNPIEVTFQYGKLGVYSLSVFDEPPEGVIVSGTNGDDSSMSSFADDQIRQIRFRYSHPNKKDKKSVEHFAKMVLTPQGANISESDMCGSCVSAKYLPCRQYANLADIANVISQLRRRKSDGSLLTVAQAIDSRVKGLEVNTEGGISPMVDLGLSELLPASAMGDGFVRLLQYAAFILSNNFQVLVIDEIDAGLHYSAMNAFWEQLARLANEADFQIFCTTHNEEMVRCAIEAFSTKPKDFSLYRVDRSASGSVGVVHTNQEDAEILTTSDYELR